MGGVWPIRAYTGLYAPLRGVKIRWIVFHCSNFVSSEVRFFEIAPNRGVKKGQKREWGDGGWEMGDEGVFQFVKRILFKSERR